MPTGKGTRNLSTDELLGVEGRDTDIFMSVSDSGYMQSPGELGFILRPWAGYLKHLTAGLGSSPAILPAVDFSVQNSVAAMPAGHLDKPAMFRTFRLYDHGGTGINQIRDDIYGHFYVMKADGTLPGASVNPLSDIPKVLEAAIWDTPLDYWFVATNNTTLSATELKTRTFNRRAMQFGEKDYLANDTVGPRPANPSPGVEVKWKTFLDGWTHALANAVTSQWNTAGGQTVSVAKNWNANLSDVYGDWRFCRWYSVDPQRLQIFGDNNRAPVAPGNLLHEIDRKMLYAHSLDVFSDRQQLFLYFLRAEAVVPSFGGGMRSLAGGRAVALVWRDPYPRGYEKENNVWDLPTGAKTAANDSARKNVNGWYSDIKDYESPWTQYFPGRNTDRWNGFHDTRILFFKQLSQ